MSDDDTLPPPSPGSGLEPPDAPEEQTDETAQRELPSGPRRDPWRTGVRFAGSGTARGFAYIPHQVIVDADAFERIEARYRDRHTPVRAYDLPGGLKLVIGIDEPQNEVRTVRGQNFRAQVNHALFATGTADRFTANPAR